jgi:predicted nuclease with TOPRIM domain
MHNHVYNLMLQLVQEHKSLWRISNEYMKDSEDCEECKTFWQNLQKDKEAHVDKLTELVKSHL